MALDAGRIEKQIIHAGIQGAGCSIPAEVEGGDFFDFIPLGKERLIAAIGDVMGKGSRAARHMKDLRAIVHACAGNNMPLLTMMEQINERGGKQLRLARSFATLCLISYEMYNARLTSLSAGHPAPLAFSGNKLRILKVKGVALGLLEGYQGTEPDTVSLAPGDVVLLYTDGLVEARNGQGQTYGLKRLENITLANSCQNAIQLRDTILNDLFTFTGRKQQRDDVTLVILKRGR
ncbi:serine phosphatase [Moorella thermoacetica]|uniref:Phosphoserine phosphatase RsbU n=2 Tax=Neomoorella thermoacetica TaxID=1525 RepID=A0AAC9MTP2_NEOTH|nr:SpoIIE family protein phosphatase [Moorella thermoacetica]AKX95783.1 phosphoserine phosphatase RsbU [Moorella thermoacetica]AOQ22799.1 Phosphoserine phosphatase RsbU [Moorella thermoacetica]APC07482.1 phosphoserine phosphatase RsbU [Moorella thermoacetica]OIQ53144.1 phosphoserine phosphatase RsbU [Moorella thermoacetica]QCZ99597.1 Phosphoserine phosphatase RsbU [Moorella thermoacetica]